MRRARSEEIKIEGNVAVGEERLRARLSPAGYTAEHEQGLRGAEIDLTLATMDDGYVESRVSSRRDGSRWVLVVREGRCFRVGRVRVVDPSSGGRSLRVPNDLRFEADGYFSRAEVARSIDTLRQRLGRDVSPEVHLGSGILQLDLVLGARPAVP